MAVVSTAVIVAWPDMAACGWMAVVKVADNDAAPDSPADRPAGAVVSVADSDALPAIDAAQAIPVESEADSDACDWSAAVGWMAVVSVAPSAAVPASATGR